MASFEQLQATLATDSEATSAYRCLADLNLYDSPTCKQLATQAASGRLLRAVALDGDTAIKVCLCEDDYPGWLSVRDLSLLAVVGVYQAIALSAAEIRLRLPQVIGFTQLAMQQPNRYLWGGTVGPNYDCSGLIQAAFASVSIWVPRDAYQQEAFAQSIAVTELLPGDLVFFGLAEKANHVGLYLGEGAYIHSSGQLGRNGIGVDRLSEQGDEIGRSYYGQLRSGGRVVRSYEPRRREGREGWGSEVSVRV